MTETLRLKNNCLTEAELVRGKNGRAIFSDWYKPKEEEECSWREIARANRVQED